MGGTGTRLLEPGLGWGLHSWPAGWNPGPRCEQWQGKGRFPSSIPLVMQGLGIVSEPLADTWMGGLRGPVLASIGAHLFSGEQFGEEHLARDLGAGSITRLLTPVGRAEEMRTGRGNLGWGRWPSQVLQEPRSQVGTEEQRRPGRGFWRESRGSLSGPISCKGRGLGQGPGWGCRIHCPHPNSWGSDDTVQDP